MENIANSRMDSSSSHENNFQLYLEKYFSIPEELKNDLIYVQRALISHLHVHQMVFQVFHQQRSADISRRKQIIQEIETEIYEINAEQQYLLIKVRRLIREFLKALSAVGMEKNQALVNQYIANLILPSVVDTKKECFPITVTRRRTEDRLIERYFEVRRDTHNPPSETISEQGNTQRPSQFRSMSSFTGSQDIAEHQVPEVISGSINQRNSSEMKDSSAPTLHNNSNNGSERLSLLKPSNQRVKIIDEPLPILPQVVLTEGEHSEVLDEINGLPTHTKIESNDKERVNRTEVSGNVRRSRMNLRQALKRAQEAARTPSKSLSNSKTQIQSQTESPTTTPSRGNTANPMNPEVAPSSSALSKSMQHSTPPKSNITSNDTSEAMEVSTVGHEYTTSRTSVSDSSKARNVRKSSDSSLVNRNASVSCKLIGITSNATVSSRNSSAASSYVWDIGCVEPSSQIPKDTENSPIAEISLPVNSAQNGVSSNAPQLREIKEACSDPYEYNQGSFMKIFGLYTPEECLQLQQRRSKRRRRCVQNNTRSDYHYGKAQDDYTQPMTNGEGDFNSTQAKNKKKRDTFLLTSQAVKKAIQQTENTKKKYRRNTSSTSTAAATVKSVNDIDNQLTGSSVSRSTSSSPDTKQHNNHTSANNNNRCHECFKNDGVSLRKCSECKFLYHPKCYNDEDCKAMVCRNCSRRMNNSNYLYAREKLVHRNLQQSMHELKTKMACERDRRNSLQREGKQYKLQMNNIIKTVNSLKRKGTAKIVAQFESDTLSISPMISVSANSSISNSHSYNSSSSISSCNSSNQSFGSSVIEVEDSLTGCGIYSTQETSVGVLQGAGEPKI